MGIARLQEFVCEQLEIRDRYLNHLCQNRHIQVGDALEQLRTGNLSKQLKSALMLELGFSSWEELTQAALSAVDT